MRTEISTNDPGVASLVSGILQDARKLLVQQFTLFQVEVKNDLKRTVMAAIPLIIGVAVLLNAPLVLAIGAAHFLSWWQPDLPLWGSFAIVAGLIAAIGAILVFWSGSMFSTFNPLPDKTLEGLKENLQWKTKT